VWWAVFYANERRIAFSTGTRNKAMVGKTLNQLLAAVGRGEPVGLTNQKLTFNDLASIIHDNYVAVGNKSLQRLESSLKNLRPFRRQTRIAD
jgi:hypothetical protein